MIIINCLEKGSIIVPIKQIDAETVAEVFLNYFIRNHGLPDAIVLDRGRAFIEGLWKCLCQLLKITRSVALNMARDGNFRLLIRVCFVCTGLASQSFHLPVTVAL